MTEKTRPLSILFLLKAHNEKNIKKKCNTNTAMLA